MSIWKRAVTLWPDLADAHYNFGVALWYSGSKSKGISELQNAVRLDPAAGASYAFLGTALRETGQLEDARRNLQRAIALLPSFPATYIDLGIVYLRADDLDKALAQFETGLRLRLDFAEAHNNTGLVLAQGNDDKAAVAEFREALRIQPAYADAHANLGTALISADSREAVRELEKALALAPALFKAQFNLAVAYGSDPRYGPAKEIDQLRKVLVAEPTFAPARLALGKALLRDGKLEQSVVELREVVRLDSQNTAAHYQLGLALARAGQNEEATAELQKSRQLASSDDRKQNTDLDIAEGRVALEKGDLDQATAKFRHALQLQPESSDAQHFLAVVLEKQGDAPGASAAYRKTLELNPGDLSAREKIESLSIEKGAAEDSQRIVEFQSYIRAGRFQEVEPLLTAYVKEHPKTAWGWYALGYSLFAQRKVGESIQALAKSLQLDIQNAEAHKILGRDLMIIGRYDAAQSEFEQGILYNPQSAEMHFNLGKLFSI